MNILFISRLYPSQPENSGEKITVALHKLVKYWYDNNKILVVRPVYIYLSEILRAIKKPLRKKYLVRDNIEIMVFPIFKIPRFTYHFSSLYRFLDHHLKQTFFAPQVVVAHFDKCLTIGYQYARRRNLPLVAGIHATPDIMALDLTAFSRRCAAVLEYASLIACRSHYIYRKVTAWFPHLEEKCFVASSGIDKQWILPSDTGIKRLRAWKSPSPDRPNKRINIITVCALIGHKKVYANLEALAQLSPEIDWQYTIIGEGHLRADLEAQAAAAGISHRVHFKGALSHEQAMDAMRESHIFMMISNLESFGLVYLEAMAAGNIVIASRDEGVDGIIEHCQNGYLSPAAQSEPLKQLLEEIILHTPLHTLENVIHGAHHTINQYTDEKVSQNYLRHLMKIMPQGK